MYPFIFQKKVSFSESEVNVYPDQNNNEEAPILLEGDKMVQDCVHGQTKTFSDKCPICILFKLNEKLDKMAAERAKGGLISEKKFTLAQSSQNCAKAINLFVTSKK